MTVWRKVPRTAEQGRREALALRLLGDGAVRLRSVEAGGALLLDRVEPGTTLADSGLDDDAVTRVLARALLRLRRPAPSASGLPTIAEEAAPLPAGAAALLADLLSDEVVPVVLHGDLHARNLLQGPDGWVVVDPHGLVGDPGWEVGPLLLNGLAGDLAAQAARRLAVLAEELGEERDRLAAWGWVRARLSLAWSRADRTLPLERVTEVAEELRGTA